MPKQRKRFSILYSLNRCALCGKTKAQTTIHIHEVFFGSANRDKSIQWGCCCGLCPEHHTIGKEAVHNNRTNDLKLKKAYESAFITQYGFEQFMAVFGRNYLDAAEIERAEQKRGEIEEAYHISKGFFDE